LGRFVRNFSGQTLPKLANEMASAEDLIDTIHDFGDELRPILYHIYDVKYFGYLLDGPEKSDK
jgi:hypothetical protein